MHLFWKSNIEQPRLRHFILPLILFLPVTGCLFSPVRGANFSENREIHEVAVIKESGYRFWVQGGEHLEVDELWLTPGEYFLAFKISHSNAFGMGLCRVEKGNLYGFEITGKEHLAKSGGYAWKGRCTIGKPMDSKQEYFRKEKQEEKKPQEKVHGEKATTNPTTPRLRRGGGSP